MSKNQITMTDDEAETFAGCLLTIVGFAISPLTILWRAYVIRKLWLWFIVSCFGVPMIGYTTAIGIGLLISLVHPQAEGTKKEGQKAWLLWLEIIARTTVTPAISLLMGWIVHQFQ